MITRLKNYIDSLMGPRLDEDAFKVRDIPDHQPIQMKDNLVKMADLIAAGDDRKTSGRVVCPECGRTLVELTGSDGVVGCSGYPDCGYVER